jgi:hypothetical protein
MSERVDGNNNTEGSYRPGSNESKTYTPLPVKMCLGILATAAIAMGVLASATLPLVIPARSKLATVK